jgi:recombination protein RecA
MRWQGRDAVKQYLRENPDVSDEIEAKIRENAHKLNTAVDTKKADAKKSEARKTAGHAVDVSADDFDG